MTYTPLCSACRIHDPATFHVSCSGCQARKARIEAARITPPITDVQVEAMDSTFGELK